MPKLAAAVAAIQFAAELGSRIDPRSVNRLVTKIEQVVRDLRQKGLPSLAHVIADQQEIAADARVIGFEPAELFRFVELIIAAAA